MTTFTICVHLTVPSNVQDEWESSDEEDGAARKITYYFNGAARTMEVEASVIQHPSLAALQSAIQ